MQCPRCAGLLVKTYCVDMHECEHHAQFVKCVLCGWYTDELMEKNRLVQSVMEAKS